MWSPCLVSISVGPEIATRVDVRFDVHVLSPCLVSIPVDPGIETSIDVRFDVHVLSPCLVSISLGPGIDTRVDVRFDVHVLSLSFDVRRSLRQGEQQLPFQLLEDEGIVEDAAQECEIARSRS